MPSSGFSLAGKFPGSHRSCLHHATIWDDHGYLTWFLLEAGADPNVLDDPYVVRGLRRTPLANAVTRWNKLNIVEILLAFNADASLENSQALYLLMVELRLIDIPLKIIRLLIQNGAKPNDADQNRRHSTPFMAAVYKVFLVICMITNQPPEQLEISPKH